MRQNPMLVSGVPASGKTTFGDFLRDQHGYLHVDLEARPENRTILHQFWSQCWRNQSVGHFFAELSVIHPRCVITWGIPFDCLPIVTTLQATNVECWWFDAEITLAESEWVRREGRQPVGVEREQFDKLRASPNRAAQLFGEKVIVTLDSKGRMPAEEIFKRTMV